MAGLLKELGFALDQLWAQRQGPAGLARRREARLAAIVAHARTSSPFYRHLYRDVLPAGRSDGVVLAELPPVTKQELMANFDDWVTDPAVTRAGVDAFIADPSLVGTPFLGQYFVCTTSGTTGHPGVFVHDPRSLAVSQAFTIRIDRAWLSPAELLALARRGLRWAAVVGTGGTTRARAGCNGRAGAVGGAGARSGLFRCNSLCRGSWQTSTTLTPRPSPAIRVLSRCSPRSKPPGGST